MTETFSHRASGAARSAVALRGFAAISCISIGVLLAASALLLPATLPIDCTRASGRCTMASPLVWQGPRTFPIATIEALAITRDSGAALGRVRERGVDLYSGETSDPAEVAALEAALVALQRFAEGEGETLHVEVPRGSPIHPVALVLVLLFGGAMVFLARRVVVASEVVLEPTARTLEVSSRRGLSLPARRRMAYGAVRAIGTRFTQPQAPSTYSFVTVVLETDESPVTLVSEYHSAPSAKAAQELAQKLSEALGVPLRAG